MNNRYSDTVNDLWEKETYLGQLVDEHEQAANAALSDLHSALEQLYMFKKAEKEVLLDVSDFIENVKEKMLKVNLPNIASKKQQALEHLENISWSIAQLFDILKVVENSIKNRE